MIFTVAWELLASSELRRTPFLKLSKKSGWPQNEGVRSLRNGAKGLISLRYAGDFCARDTTERLFRQFLEGVFSEVRIQNPAWPHGPRAMGVWAAKAARVSYCVTCRPS